MCSTTSAAPCIIDDEGALCKPLVKPALAPSLSWFVYIRFSDISTCVLRQPFAVDGSPLYAAA